MSLENMPRISNEIAVDTSNLNITEIVPMDDVILEIVWSDEYKRLICIARVL